MRYFTYPWKEGEFENLLVEKVYNIHDDERFVGPLLLPFLGGVLIGGLFLPRPNIIPPYGPVYTPVPTPYIQNVPYVTETPTYSTPVTSKIK